MGVIVPKHKHGSVERNLLKRQLRELVRTRLLPGLPAMDLVIRAFPEAYAASFDALRAQLERGGERLRRAGLPSAAAARPASDAGPAGGAGPR